MRARGNQARGRAVSRRLIAWPLRAASGVRSVAGDVLAELRSVVIESPVNHCIVGATGGLSKSARYLPDGLRCDRILIVLFLCDLFSDQRPEDESVGHNGVEIQFLTLPSASWQLKVTEATMADSPYYRLDDGACVAVIGGGPAGAFFANFVLDMASRAGRRINVDIYEPRDFTQVGVHGCNGCAGIVSERLVQIMADEGIDLPATVVQRKIDSYMVHMDAGSARITPSRPGTRIAAVHRGAGPRDLRAPQWTGLDALRAATSHRPGRAVIHQRVSNVAWADGRPVVGTTPRGCCGL